MFQVGRRYRFPQPFVEKILEITKDLPDRKEITDSLSQGRDTFLPYLSRALALPSGEELANAAGKGEVQERFQEAAMRYLEVKALFAWFNKCSEKWRIHYNLDGSERT